MLNFIKKHISIKIKVFVLQCLHWPINIIEFYWYKFFVKPRMPEVDPYNIPIIINNYNRLEYLKRLIASLEKRGYNNIYILDNKSTYPPLLDYYKKCEHKVLYLNENLGFKALWKSDVFKQFKNNYYVYTDPDLEICEECPRDFMSLFLDIIEAHPGCQKVGFGIKIDDIPDYYTHKDSVIKNELKFWEKEVAPNIYRAWIDTTLALYSPYRWGIASPVPIVFRTAGKYMVKHLPWYVDSNNLSEEERYYIEHSNQSTSWTNLMKGNL